MLVCTHTHILYIYNVHILMDAGSPRHWWRWNGSASTPWKPCVFASTPMRRPGTVTAVTGPHLSWRMMWQCGLIDGWRETRFSICGWKNGRYFQILGRNIKKEKNKIAILMRPMPSFFDAGARNQLCGFSQFLRKRFDRNFGKKTSGLLASPSNKFVNFQLDAVRA